MAKILDKGNFWELVMDTAAKPVETIDEPARGFKAIIGENRETGKHVVMNVLYDKKMSTLDDVQKRVEQLRTCGRCQALDKEKMKIDEIQVGPAFNPPSSSTIIGSAAVRSIDTSVDSPPASAPASAPAVKPLAVKDMFANVFFDAFLTRPGKYFFSVLSGDDALMESVMPHNDDEMNSFMDEMVEFMSGNMEFVRSPEEAREFLSVMRAARGDDTGTGTSAVRAIKKKVRKELPMMTVY